MYAWLLWMVYDARHGTPSSTFERLLLAHLHAYLPHRQYELARVSEPRVSMSRGALEMPGTCPVRFFVRLLHEFLLEQRPNSSAATLLQCFSDVRLQPAALHAARLALLHNLANPCLRQGCEDTAERMSFGRGAWVTREMAILGPGVVRMLCELLKPLGSEA